MLDPAFQAEIMYIFDGAWALAETKEGIVGGGSLAEAYPAAGGISNKTIRW